MSIDFIIDILHFNLKDSIILMDNRLTKLIYNISYNKIIMEEETIKFFINNMY